LISHQTLFRCLGSFVRLLYNHGRMKLILLQIWKWLPFGLQKLFYHVLQPSFLVFAAAVIFNPEKKILLGKTTYQRIHPWGLLGGGLKLGEDPEQGVVREILEETGLKVEVKKLLMAKNSRVRNQIGLFYLCELQAGEFYPSDEISEIAYFDVEHLPDVYPSDVALLKLLQERVEKIENELA